MTAQEIHLTAVLKERQLQNVLDNVNSEISILERKRQRLAREHMEAVQAVNEARDALEPATP
jgi:hypothetical protein